MCRLFWAYLHIISKYVFEVSDTIRSYMRYWGNIILVNVEAPSVRVAAMLSRGVCPRGGVLGNLREY